MRSEIGVLGAVIVAVLVSGTSSSRILLQQTNNCANIAQPLGQGVCNSLLSQQAALSNPNVTDSQIQAFTLFVGPPSDSCCAAMEGLVKAQCQCNGQVQNFAGNYNVTSDQLVLLARYAKISCGPDYIPASTQVYCNGTAPASG